MPTINEMSVELAGQIPGLSRLFAAKFINRALEAVQKDYLWSWMIGEGILVIPDAVSTGLVAVTKYSPTITFNATSIAVLDPLALANPPLIERQFRIPGGPVYNIISYVPITGIATLDRAYLEETNSAASYNIYRCYYNPPSSDGITPNTDFLRYLSILNNIQGYSIRGKRLYMTREILNQRDPLRGALGYPYYAAAYKPTATGLMQYELWPHPTFGMALLCQYEKKHVDLLASESLPNQCSSTLIQYRAFEYAYRWATQNVGRIPELRGTDWRFLLVESQKKYAFELVGAKRNDKEILLNILTPGNEVMSGFSGPIDSNFYQSHGLPALT